MTDAQEWIDQLTDPSDEEEKEEEEESTSMSLFEENFRKLLQQGEVEDMTVETLQKQVDRINDPDLLAEAIEKDTRTTAKPVYESRIEELEGSDGESEPEADDVDEDVDESESKSTPTEAIEEGSEGEEELDDESPSDDDGVSPAASDTEQSDLSELPDVDVSSLAPDSVSREKAAEADKERTLLVWGPEGSGKSHVAHSAPEPICYIDTEGKADELADKFDGKRIHYFEASDYSDAKAAMQQSLDVLHEYLEQGFRGTIVVDSMTAMWEFAKVDYAKYAYQTEQLSGVNFQSELQGEKDWTKIKARHNEEFREKITDSPFHVVFTSGQKEDYNAVFEGGGKVWQPDGEKWNKYAVKDVVRLRRNDEGKTVGDLRKAARTRYSFVGMEWPTWEKIYDAIERVYEAEMSPEDVDLTNWEFGVVDGQPVEESEGSDNEE